MRQKLSDHVRRQVEEEISSGVLVPGAQIDEQGLAARFDVSRTPAREALIALSMAGLVRLVPRRGAIVTGTSASDAISLFEVLVVLEAEAAKLAARRMTGAARTELRQVHEGGRTAVEKLSQAEYGRTNAAFHALIYTGSNNAYLTQQIKLTRNRLRAFRRSGFETASRIRGSFEEHRKVMEAVAVGDDLSAHAAMVEHISVGGRVFADVVAAMATA
jgi:DNA-binding GntR family transcriptional regulator